MFTAAKLVGALLFAGIGWVAGNYVIDTLPEGMRATLLPPTIAAIGLWQGWYVMGNHVGSGWMGAAGNGLRTSIQIAFFGLMYFAFREMFLRSADLRYGGFGEAVIAALDLFIEYFWQIQTTPILVTLIAGGIVAGFLTEAAARAWR